MSRLGQRLTGHQHRILDLPMVWRTPQIARFDRDRAALLVACPRHVRFTPKSGH
jgi:hypothetical protein